MKNLDNFENELLDAFEQGKLKSISPTRADLAKYKVAATANFLKKNVSISVFHHLI